MVFVSTAATVTAISVSTIFTSFRLSMVFLFLTNVSVIAPMTATMMTLMIIVFFFILLIYLLID
jgi:hypothetical protein